MDDVLGKGDALLIVDVQNDFCPGGALPIPEGDRVVPVLNEWIARAVEAGVPVYASRDWHPEEHPSFASQGGPWPRHCVQDTEGAQFHPDLRLPPGAIIVSKGTRFDHDQRSAFRDTGLAAKLERDGVRRLYVGGLAQDVCVRQTVLDARRNGLEVYLIPDGSLPITPEGGREAIHEMERAGAVIGHAQPH